MASQPRAGGRICCALDGYSGWDGVAMSGVNCGTAAFVASPSRTAWIGLQWR